MSIGLQGRESYVLKFYNRICLARIIIFPGSFIDLCIFVAAKTNDTRSSMIKPY